MIVGVLTFLFVQLSNWVARQRSPHIEACASGVTQRERTCDSSAQHGSMEGVSASDRETEAAQR